jgi:glycosyltransferase involved in cell wall biosynthesis
MKVFFLGDIDHPNTQNWVNGFRNYGGCEVVTWSLPWPKGRYGILKRLIFSLWALFTLKKKIKQFNPDIVIGYRLTSYGFIAAFTGFHPLIIAQQGETDVWPMNHWSTPIKSFLARYAIKRADLVHAWGENMALSVYDLGGEKEKVLVLPRGIDLSNFYAEADKPFDKLQVFASRALHPDYGYDVIIRAIHSLKEIGIPVGFRIAGSGSKELGLKQMVQYLGLDSEIDFLGRISNEELRNELRACNVYISMPVTDGLSSSLLEAMACYCIPVVSDLPANRQLISNRVNGFLVAIGDDKELTNTLSYLWHNKEKFKTVLQKNRILVEQTASQKTNTEFFIKKYKELLIV